MEQLFEVSETNGSKQIRENDQNWKSHQISSEFTIVFALVSSNLTLRKPRTCK